MDDRSDFVSSSAYFLKSMRPSCVGRFIFGIPYCDGCFWCLVIVVGCYGDYEVGLFCFDLIVVFDYGGVVLSERLINLISIKWWFLIICCLSLQNGR